MLIPYVSVCSIVHAPKGGLFWVSCTAISTDQPVRFRPNTRALRAAPSREGESHAG